MARGWKEFFKGIQQRQKPTVFIPCSVNGMVFSGMLELCQTRWPRAHSRPGIIKAAKAN